MNFSIFCRWSLFHSWLGQGLISTPVKCFHVHKLAISRLSHEKLYKALNTLFIYVRVYTERRVSYIRMHTHTHTHNMPYH